MIRFEALTKRYGTHRAVEALSLELAAGEVVALLGPNGSGKTTSLKVAAGLVLPTSGRVLAGDPPASTRDPAARRALSFLPQRVSFPDSLTGREVLEFYRRLRGAPPGAAEQALRAASLDGAAERAVGTYSGGMTQRLGLAVAALPDARAYLLDEPTSALDADGLAAFYTLVERWRGEGRTVLFSSHQLGDAERLADRIAILVDGRLVAALGQRELADRLAARGRMRLRLDACPAGLAERLAALAPGARWTGEELVIPGPPALRAQALELARAAGAEIRSLTAEDGRLEPLYRELVEGSA
ncbi:ABC transporter ATP-binding protein [Anaeromyxobacter sp. PSR-1]|uniref:ABC transporter ATP-binding protein n=1 Tax=Anaeromyxobacter sp. PSR-1 TaxID=1300915 RepID=UPI0005E1773C|nr:ABC transporter ATP-binding protein [Anaeromyxobacter sp. PSR-1]GAO03531.1 copper transport ATP-binding protein NosF [Anaeromyxobacter sp. PSR-1]